MRHIGVGIGLGFATLALPGLGAPSALACGWLWACADRPYARGDVPRAYRYRNGPRAYRYRRRGWAYGYTSPRRILGDPYAAWPSTSIPPSRRWLQTAPPIPDASEPGPVAPFAGGRGLVQSGLPAKGPSLFGPQPAPIGAYGYYSGAPAYGYRPPSYWTPPPDTPSWWLEPRRRQ